MRLIMNKKAGKKIYKQNNKYKYNMKTQYTKMIENE